MAQNPLATRAGAPPRQEHPMMAHARAHQMAHSLDPAAQLPKADDYVSYVTPILGKLASDPNVTSKDVVKAASQAVADGKLSGTKAVEFLTKMPADPDALRPWLKGLYAQNMTMMVHLKAAVIKNMQGGPPQAPPQAAQAPAGAMPPQGAPPGPQGPVAAPSGPVQGVGT